MINVDGTRMPSTQVKAYDSSDTEKAKQVNLKNTVGSNIQGMCAIANKGSPNTWYHVEEGGSVVTVVEADPECNTPVMDECPSPPRVVTQDNSVSHDQTKDHTQNTIITEENLNATPHLVNMGTQMLCASTKNVASNTSPPPTRDMGTDPINWDIEETKRFLRV